LPAPVLESLTVTKAMTPSPQRDLDVEPKLLLWHPRNGSADGSVDENWLEIPVEWLPGMFISTLFGTVKRCTTDILFDSDPSRIEFFKSEIQRLSQERETKLEQL